MKIYLVRHGQTLFNEKGFVQGWCDSPLTKKGIQQAKSLAKVLCSVDFEYAYCSTSERTEDTLNYIIKNRDVGYARLKGLKEMNFGSLEGDLEEKVFSKETGINHITGFRKYGGETMQDTGNRMYTTLEKIAQKHDGNVLVVAHGGCILNFLSMLDLKQIETMLKSGKFIENCSVTILKYNGSFSIEQLAKEVDYEDIGN